MIKSTVAGFAACRRSRAQARGRLLAAVLGSLGALQACDTEGDVRPDAAGAAGDGHMHSHAPPDGAAPEPDAAGAAASFAWELPAGFPLPIVPASNPITEEKVELGRFLFYDERLSGNGRSRARAATSRPARSPTADRSASAPPGKRTRAAR